jgi:hypothetical protein
MFETLSSSVMSLIALVGFFSVTFYGCETRHNTQHSEGKRGAEFDHTDDHLWVRGSGLSHSSLVYRDLIVFITDLSRTNIR